MTRTTGFRYFPPVTPWTSHRFLDQNNLYSLPAATAVLIDTDAARHWLPKAESDFLAAVVARKPDVETTDQLSLDPPYRVIVNELDLALEPDELILMHGGGTTRWKSPGVRDRILTQAGIE